MLEGLLAVMFESLVAIVLTIAIVALVGGDEPGRDGEA